MNYLFINLSSATLSTEKRNLGPPAEAAELRSSEGRPEVKADAHVGGSCRSQQEHRGTFSWGYHGYQGLPPRGTKPFAAVVSSHLAATATLHRPVVRGCSALRLILGIALAWEVGYSTQAHQGHTTKSATYHAISAP